MAAQTLPGPTRLIDLFTLALTHGLMALALWRLAFRPELDDEDGPGGPRRPWHKADRARPGGDGADA